MIRFRSAQRDALVVLSDLIPAAKRDLIVEFWDVGEWGLAIESLTGILADHHLPVGQAQREQLMALASPFELIQTVVDDLRWCPDPNCED